MVDTFSYRINNGKYVYNYKNWKSNNWYNNLIYYVWFNDYPTSILIAYKIEIQEKGKKRSRLPWYDGNKKKYKNYKRLIQCPVCPKRENR